MKASLLPPVMIGCACVTKTMSTTNDNIAATTPLISMGLAVHNGASYLVSTLNALLAQTLTDFELIICDNASTDSTSEICREFASCHNRIRFYRNETNIGSVMNHQRTLELARGEYFRWASANDLCSPLLLERCAAVLKANPEVVLTFGLTTLIDNEGKILKENDEHLHLMQDSPSERFITYLDQVGLINQFAGLVRTSALRKARPLGNYIASDIVLLGELVLMGKIYEIQEQLFFRRLSKEASTQRKSIVELKEFYNPKGVGHIALPLWRQQGELFRAIMRSSIPLADKWRATYFVVKCFYWRRQRLSGELRGVVTQMGYRADARSAAGAGEKKVPSSVNSPSQTPKM